MTESDHTVLIVEDDESLRQIVVRHLRGRGYTVAEAATAEDAATAIDAGLRPDVVVLDLNLPGDTGWDLLRGPHLSASDAPPVVICTSVTVNPRQLAEFNVAGYLPKPFPLETLVDTLERLLHGEGVTNNK